MIEDLKEVRSCLKYYALCYGRDDKGKVRKDSPAQEVLVKLDAVIERVLQLKEELRNTQISLNKSCANQAWFYDGDSITHVTAIPTLEGLYIGATKDNVVLQQIPELHAQRIVNTAINTTKGNKDD